MRDRQGVEAVLGLAAEGVAGGGGFWFAAAVAYNFAGCGGVGHAAAAAVVV